MEDKTGFFYRVWVTALLLLLMPLGVLSESLKSINETFKLIVGVVEGKQLTTLAIDMVEKKIVKWKKEVDTVKATANMFDD